MINFIKTAASSKTLNIIVILIIAAAIPLTVIVSQKQQETRQRAAAPAAPLLPSTTPRPTSQTFNCAKWDFNHDGTIDELDIAAVASHYESSDSAYDINGDGKVDKADLDIMADHFLESCPTPTPTPTSTPAAISCSRMDFDHDGQITILDISLAARYFGTHNPAYDLNGDGIVDRKDLDILAAHFLEKCPTTATSTPTLLPK